MNKKLENYINYIVDGLVEDTVVNYDPKAHGEGKVVMPWQVPPDGYSHTVKHFIDTLRHPFVWEERFSDYIEDMYGVPDDLKLYIWLNYKEEIYQKYFKGANVKNFR